MRIRLESAAFTLGPVAAAPATPSVEFMPPHFLRLELARHSRRSSSKRKKATVNQTAASSIESTVI